MVQTVFSERPEKQEGAVMNKQETAVLKRLLRGEWVNEKDVETYLNIDTSDAMRFFDQRYTSRWCRPPINKCKITTEYRLRYMDE